MEYQLIRSGRRTLALEIGRDGGLIARAPMRMSRREIDAFIAAKADWIEQHRKKMLARALPPLTPEKIRELKARAVALLPARTARWAEIMGIDYARVAIGSAKKRLGSCTSAGVITFSLYLMQYPEEVIDYVIVHELAHRKEMNHSARFYAVIARYLPDYKLRIRMMKETPRAI